MTENCRDEHGEVLRVDLLAELALLRRGGAAFSFAGAIRVTSTCSRRSAATAASDVVGDALAVDGLSSARPARKCKCRHTSSLFADRAEAEG